MSSSFRFNDQTLASQEGFTLIEVLISIVLLVVISLSIYQTTTSTYKLRDTLLHEGDFHNGVRLAMGIIDRDVNVLFSPSMLLPTSAPAPTPSNNPNGQNGAASNLGNGAPVSDALPEVHATDYWGALLDKSYVRAPRFIGKESEMSFIAASHIRVFKDAQESEFAKVHYMVQDDPRPPEGVDEPAGKILVKTVSPNVFTEDDDKDKMKHQYALLRGIQKLSIKYCSVDKDRCYPSWDSDSADFKNLYPDRIELTLEVAGPNRLKFSGLYKFKPEIPFNGLDESF